MDCAREKLDNPYSCGLRRLGNSGHRHGAPSKITILMGHLEIERTFIDQKGWMPTEPTAASRAAMMPHGRILPSCENEMMARVRMDKWLWAARFFKTRSLAARACELGRIASNGQPAKSSREVRVGDLLQVQSGAGDFQVEVLLLLGEMRGPAAVAQTLYRETEASRELRLKLAEERKAMPHIERSRAGKPSKRDRRRLDRFRGRV
jgi:ribosome-associated heat shock protein Hsp15